LRPLLYRPEAADEVERAHAWYERQREGLGEEFLAELRRAERRVQESPHVHRVIHRGTRRFLLHRFPYQLLYRIVDDTVVIVACFHGRRSPKRWTGRR
jgi:plasmid stabilization system protein ParE